ncbi:BREX-2 system adenine-specific DNA-methyltransferase PglX [Azospirillum palustre]
MIDAKALLTDLKRLLRTLETDIRERVVGSPLEDDLRADWQAARDAKRTAQTFAAWLDEEVTQAAVHWVLACVFLRFVEDNGLVDRPWLSGPGERLELARDRHDSWIRANPTGEERDFLLDCFAEAAELPGLGALFDRRHNPLWRLPVSGDGAIALRGFWQKRDPDSGALLHDFTDPEFGTRFLGDLYQDLSEAARKRFALLQTPEFVEEFILDRTLDPAIREFGFREVRLIDPTCGSGHFLLGAFRRLFDLWTRHEPGRNVRDCAQQALDAVSGVDVNPFAAAIARFRLLVAALTACGIASLRGAPDFHISVAVGDSLLHGKRFMDVRGWQMSFDPQGGLAHVSFEEDREALDRILGRQYHAVVGNPPYIRSNDTALNEAYKERYSSCYGQFTLVVPFIERFFDLCVARRDDFGAGFTGMIVSDAFMKGKFGKKVVENFLSKIDLTAIINAKGAHIPGHGTPTIIMFGRNQPYFSENIRIVASIKDEPGIPVRPESGFVWSAIASKIDCIGWSDEYIEVIDASRKDFERHPWIIGSEATSNLKKIMEEGCQDIDKVIASPIGRAVRIALEELYLYTKSDIRRKNWKLGEFKNFLAGESVRNWVASSNDFVWFPYSGDISNSSMLRWLWSWKISLKNRSTFQGNMEDAGLDWFEYMQYTASAYDTPHTVTFSFVATHGNFCRVSADHVYNRTAPVIKYPASIDQSVISGTLGLLNSSIGGFWLRQMMRDKGGSGIGRGVQDESWEGRLTFDGGKLERFPVCAEPPHNHGALIDELAQALTTLLPASILSSCIPTRADLDAAKARALSTRRRMIAMQEELDFRCYKLYGLLNEEAEHPAPPEVDLGERAFEIVMARKMADGELETTWFARHGSTPVTDIPARWPADYRALVERRIALIAENRWIELVERPEYKRRWQWDDQGFDAGWHKREQAALKEWLLDRLEGPRHWSGDPALTSVVRLADRARGDADFMAVAELYTGRPDFDAAALVADLVAAESVPFLPVLRYTDEGLRKRRDWEATWDLQRREDAIDARTELPEGHPDRLTADAAKALKAREVGDIPVPPKYKRTDFRANDFWRLRGGLDVPKERFVSYPGAERDSDGSLVVAWAGYDHLQQATALASHYYDMKENEGWGTERLIPLLAGVRELVPWLVQWHNEYNPDFGVGLGDYYRSFVEDEARALGLTADDLRAWTPPVRPGARRGRRAS